MSGETSPRVREVFRRVIDGGGAVVLLPGFMQAFPLAESLQLPKLRRLLSRAEEIKLCNGDLSLEQLASFSLVPDLACSGAAAFTYQHDFAQPVPEGKVVMRVDPVYQQLDMNHATLASQQALAIKSSEASALIKSLNEFFAEDGLRIEGSDPHHWYGLFDHTPQVTTTALAAAVEHDIATVRPTGKDARDWRKRLAEIEMLLYDHPVNIDRQARGMLPINSLWLWGEGSIDKNLTASKARVVTDNHYTQSIASYFDMQSTVYSDTGFILPTADQSALIAIESVGKALYAGDAGAPEKTLQTLEESLFKPLWLSLQAAGWTHVLLWCGGSSMYLFNAKEKRKFWRKPKSLTEFVTPVDEA